MLFQSLKIVTQSRYPFLKIFAYLTETNIQIFRYIQIADLIRNSPNIGKSLQSGLTRHVIVNRLSRTNFK